MHRRSEGGDNRQILEQMLVTLNRAEKQTKERKLEILHIHKSSHSDQIDPNPTPSPPKIPTAALNPHLHHHHTQSK